MLEPYWTNINWVGLAGLITAIAALSAPFFNGWWANKTTTTTTKIKQTETELERVERLQREQYERLEKRAKEAELEAAKCSDECEQCRNQSRGMEDWAHFMRHGFVGLQQRFFALVDICEKQIAGEYAPERFRVTIEQTRNSMPISPPNIPLMRDADKSRPPERPA